MKELWLRLRRPLNARFIWVQLVAKLAASDDLFFSLAGIARDRQMQASLEHIHDGRWMWMEHMLLFLCVRDVWYMRGSLAMHFFAILNSVSS